MGLIGAILLLIATPGLAGAESPFVADLATFSTRYQEDPPRLNVIRAGLEAAVKTDPDLPNLLALAQVCFLWGDIRARTLDQKLAAYEEGREAGERAVALAPKNPLAHLWYVVNTARWGQSKGILRSLLLLPTVKREIQTILHLDPTLPPAYALAGKVYYEVPAFLGGDLKTAERMFRKGLELDPRFTAMRVGLSKTLIKEGRPAEATQELERALTETNPESQADWALKDSKQALRLLESLDRQSP